MDSLGEVTSFLLYYYGCIYRGLLHTKFMFTTLHTPLSQPWDVVEITILFYNKETRQRKVNDLPAQGPTVSKW